MEDRLRAKCVKLKIGKALKEHKTTSTSIDEDGGMANMQDYISGMPKAELHVHIEGCVEPSMLLKLAKRNGVELPFASESDVWAAQDYGEPALDSFLRYHENCLRVLQTDQDFYELAYSFFEKCQLENIHYVEVMIEGQAHTSRGVEFSTYFPALNRARADAKRDFKTDAKWILNLQRDHSVESSMEVLEMARPYIGDIEAIGLDNYEVHDFGLKFEGVFDQARNEGYRLTSHCDCDQPNSNAHIHQCLDVLKVERIDHGLQVLEDQKLIDTVLQRKIPLTMCPTWRPSDPAPRRVDAIKKMMDLGILVSVNTDDPAEFASRYLSNTMIEVQRHGELSTDEVVQLARNAFVSSWLSQDKKAGYLASLDEYAASHMVD